ncbi:unnamed protein product [Gongylonema pulchrum]|uniref:Protein kinase domain-containing protein n=1 Tax=Gongylonema pulchrum TaxID=637853 RepID=A0A183ELT2_9BILA|nr:unnamed protein product [Gongylonema pulchrum]
MASVGSPTVFQVNSQLSNSGYQCSDIIGKGTYSIVRLAWSKKLAKNVAIKIIDTRSKSDYIVRFLPRELKIVPTLNHNNVVKVYDASFFVFFNKKLRCVDQVVHLDTTVCIIQEYADGKDLLCEIKKRGRIEENIAKFLIRQLVEALEVRICIKLIHASTFIAVDFSL